MSLCVCGNRKCGIKKTHTTLRHATSAPYSPAPLRSHSGWGLLEENPFQIVQLFINPILPLKTHRFPHKNGNHVKPPKNKRELQVIVKAFSVICKSTSDLQSTQNTRICSLRTTEVTIHWHVSIGCGPLPGCQWPPGWHYFFWLGDSQVNLHWWLVLGGGQAPSIIWYRCLGWKQDLPTFPAVVKVLGLQYLLGHACSWSLAI